MQIVDNVLEPDQFKTLQDIMLGTELPWYYNPFVTYFPTRDDYTSNLADREGSKLTHTFWRPLEGPTSQYYQYLLPLLSKLNTQHVVKIKANCLLKTNTIIEHVPHVDTRVNCTTVVYYLNTTNGYTHFEESGKKVDTIENRAIIFNSRQWHGGTSCTDAARRIVLNINIHEEE
jgi:hypothetical protein